MLQMVGSFTIGLEEKCYEWWSSPEKSTTLTTLTLNTRSDSHIKYFNTLA